MKIVVARVVFTLYGIVERSVAESMKASSHSPIFDITMRLVREDQRHGRRSTR